MWEAWVQFLGQEVLLEKEMATHSSTFAWKISWTEEPDGLQFMGLERVRHNMGDKLGEAQRGGVKIVKYRNMCCIRNY